MVWGFEEMWRLLGIYTTIRNLYTIGSPYSIGIEFWLSYYCVDVTVA